MTSRKRTELTLSKKVELIKLAKKSGKSQRKLAEYFAIGKSQEFNILKRKREFIDAFEQNAPDTKRRFQATPNDEINTLTWQWFEAARLKKIPLSGPLIQEQALSFAKGLGVTDFKASNGWLESFKPQVVRSGQRDARHDPRLPQILRI